jgi:hypothetical protein
MTVKKIFTLMLAATLLAPVGAGLVTGTAYAQKARASRDVSAGPRVTIVYVRDYVGPDEFDDVPRTYRLPSKQTLAKGQAEIRNVPNIRAALQKRGIPPSRVVGVQTAFNGGKIVYVD